MKSIVKIDLGTIILKRTTWEKLRKEHGLSREQIKQLIIQMGDANLAILPLSKIHTEQSKRDEK